MDWTREDVRYAVATAAAVVLVGVLAAGNFGLLPSPLPGVGRQPVDDVTVPVLAAGEPAAGVPAGQPGDAIDVDEAANVLGSVIPPAPTAPDPGPAPAPADTTAPVTTITTADDTVMVGVDRAPVTGRVTDGASGVASVEVTFENQVTGRTDGVLAEPSCDGAARRNCTWEVDPPSAAGTYEISARATDHAGNVESPGAEPITVTIVTVQTSDDPDDGDDGGLGGLVDGVRKLLGI